MLKSITKSLALLPVSRGFPEKMSQLKRAVEGPAICLHFQKISRIVPKSRTKSFSLHQSSFRKPVYSRHFPQNKISKTPKNLTLWVNPDPNAHRHQATVLPGNQLLLHQVSSTEFKTNQKHLHCGIQKGKIVSKND